MQRSQTTKLTTFLICIFACAGPVYSADKYLKVDYPASSVAGELQVPVTYTLWIPDGVVTLRGIIVHQHGAGTTASKEGSRRLRPPLAGAGANAAR